MPPADKPTPDPMIDPSVIDHHSDIRGKCPSMNSGFADDRACIPAPPEGEGMQIHIGPKDYKDTAETSKLIMRPGEESSECWTFVTPNTSKIYYQTSMFSGRAGTHHIINSVFDGPLPEGGFTVCGGDGSASMVDSIPGASKPFMPRGVVAPEYADVGRSIEPRSTVQADMHYFNFTDKDILREFWLNIYFAKAETIKREAEPIRALAGFSWNLTPIQPGTDMVYKYECPVKGQGFILDFLGHYHAHGKRFTASIKRTSGAVDKVFEMYDYLTPATFEYNTMVMNPAFSTTTAGAVSGQLPVNDGDVVQWECHIINDSDAPLYYTNQVKTGEMCNLWGTSLGIEPLNCFIP